MANTVSRRVHVVRVYNPHFDLSDPVPNKMWVDVKVVDALGLGTADGDEQIFEVVQTDTSTENETSSEDEIGSGGQERLYDVSSANVRPFITDPTGDYTEPKGSAGVATRASHIKALTITGDDLGSIVTSGFDTEVLDKFVLKGPNGSEVLLDMSNELASPFIQDTTVNAGTNDLATKASAATTRALHVAEVVGTIVTTDANGNPVSASDKASSPTLLIEMTDKVAFKAPNGEEFLIDMSPGNKAEPTEGTGTNTQENDTTFYVTNSIGQKVPPVNADPNPYIVFPTDSTSLLGFQNGLTGPALQALVPDQGLLWWIVGFGQTFKQGVPPPPPSTYTGYYILYPPTQNLGWYEYFGVSDGGWTNIGEIPYAGPFSLEAAVATGNAFGPFTSDLAELLLTEANAWINAYNTAGITVHGSYPAINIVEPPGSLPGETQFVVQSTGNPDTGSPFTGQTFTGLPLFIVQSQDGLDNPPYGG